MIILRKKPRIINCYHIIDEHNLYSISSSLLKQFVFSLKNQWGICIMGNLSQHFEELQAKVRCNQHDIHVVQHILAKLLNLPLQKCCSKLRSLLLRQIKILQMSFFGFSLFISILRLSIHLLLMFLPLHYSRTL